jgi:hypothetical protein
MKRTTHLTLAIAALALVFGGWQVSTAQAQGHTYPNSYFGTPSASYYNLGNANDTDTYMNPNPFPSYNARPYGRPYEEQVYSSNSPYGYPPAVSLPYPNNTYPPPNFRSYPRGVFTQPLPRAADYHGYDPAVPGAGYYFGPGPFEYAHYDRSGRMAFRYGWW